MKRIWNKETGEAVEVESVDAREMLANSPDTYTDVNPDADADDPDGDGTPGGPQNVANVENEFRREPVGDDVPAPPREGVVIRNPVSDQPRMAPRPTSATAAAEAGHPGPGAEPQASAAGTLSTMSVSELREYAATRNPPIDLGDATKRADIVARIEAGTSSY